ncbi:MAG: adhesin, partial [Imperialibacter sp.]
MKKPATLLSIFLCIIFLSIAHFGQAQDEDEAPKFDLEKLGKELNTGHHESGPIISPDGNTLYWVVSNSPENTYGEDGSQDIWYSTRDADGNWTQAVHAGAPFNIHKFNKVLGITTDGNTLMLNGGARKNEPGFSIVRRSGNSWSAPTQVNIPNYDGMNKGLFSGSFMSNDAKVVIMYFTERVKGKYSDLYISFDKGGKRTPPAKMPEGINTVYDEFGPFLAADGVTLYFASNRPGGLGSTDIYMAKRLDDTWMKWSKPVNLGEPVNTKGFDAYFSISGDGQNAFTTRSYTTQDGGSLDIFGLVPAKA